MAVPVERPDEIRDVPMDRLRDDVQALIGQGETEENIARFIAGYPGATADERGLARIILAHRAARSHGVLSYLDSIGVGHD